MKEQEANKSILKKISILLKKINEDWKKADKIHQQIEDRKNEALLQRMKSDYPKMF